MKRAIFICIGAAVTWLLGVGTQAYGDLPDPSAKGGALDALSLLAIFSGCYLVSWVLANPVRKIGMSTTIIELAAGFILGNWLLTFEQAKAIAGVSEIGALALFFLVGFHTNLREVKAFKEDIAFVVCIGAVSSILSMMLLFAPLGLTFVEGLFSAAIVMATGVSVVMRVLQEFHFIEKRGAKFLLACSAMEDIPAILLLAFAAAVAKQGGAMNMQVGMELLVKLGIGGLVLVVMMVLIGKSKMPSITLPLLLPAVIILSWATHSTGFTSLLGAFIVGVICKHADDKRYEEYIKPIMDFSIPVFFIMVGMRINLDTLMQPKSWLLALILTAVAFGTKMLCLWGIHKKSKSSGIDPWMIVFGMLPRGLPGLVFATVALNAGYINEILFCALVMMVTVTNTIGLTLLSYRVKQLLHKAHKKVEEPDDLRSIEG